MTRRIPDLAKPQFSRRYEVHPVKLVSAATLILSASSKGGQYTEINELYTTVLSAALENKMLEQSEQHQMKLVLWTVVCACEPLDVETIAALVGIGARKASILLQSLFSVVHVSKASGMVTTLHASFPDFLLDESRSNRLHCNEARHHEVLAKECFTIMERQLRFNICELESSFVPDSEVQDLASRISRAISPTLSYVAHHWGSHAARSPVGEYLQTRLQEFLSSRLLLWMEVLSLKRTLGVGISMLSELKSWASHYHFVTTQVSYTSSTGPNSPAGIGPRLSGRAKLDTTGRELGDALRAICSIILSRRLSTCYRFEDGTIHIFNHTAALWYWDLSVDIPVSSDPYRSPPTDLCSPQALTTHSHRLGCIHWHTNRRPIKAHDDKTLSVCFSSLTVTISCQGLWTVPRVSGTHALAVSYPTPPHVTLIQSYTLHSSRRQYTVTGHVSGDVRVWSVQDGTIIHELAKVHSNWIRSIAFSPRGSKLLIASADGTVYAWDPQSGYGEPWLFGRHREDTRCVVFSPDGTRAISCSSDRTVKLWNALHSTSSDRQPWKAPTNGVWSVAVSPDGSRIAAASGDHTIYMFSVQNGSATLEPLVAHTAAIYYSWRSRMTAGAIRSISFSPHGRWVASASDDGAIRMWDVGDGTLTASDLVAKHESAVHSVSFSSDGKRVVSGCADRSIRVWDPQTLSLLLGPFGSQAHTDMILSATFSPNGTLIASGSLDCPLNAHTGWIWSVVFSPDGTHIVSGSSDGTIGVWTYSPDGAYIISGSFDSTIRVWTAPGILTASRVLQSVSSSSGQMTPHNAITGVLKISEDGWLRNDKSQLVFWVPPEMADIVPIFPSYLRIWSQGSLRVSYGKPLSLGNKWDQCYADEE
ncbi:WD40 repeat-like protein [Rhizoctonia solani]|uniref:WD40 repeat-like protein n=1 Tax=Rhizoctonia solani TaxID=456999 RepID=A0A8H7I3R2_9AGAM|nr:WD40 repeat-like protein [Rhizoctonia solani]